MIETFDYLFLVVFFFYAFLIFHALRHLISFLYEVLSDEVLISVVSSDKSFCEEPSNQGINPQNPSYLVPKTASFWWKRLASCILKPLQLFLAHFLILIFSFWVTVHPVVLRVTLSPGSFRPYWFHLRYQCPHKGEEHLWTPHKENSSHGPEHLTWYVTYVCMASV